MSSIGLKELRLPQVVEERRKREIEIDIETYTFTGLEQRLSGPTMASDMPSPTTPTSSLRGQARLSSSSSSLTSLPNIRESVNGYVPANRPLTDVKEEVQDKDEDENMVDSVDAVQALDAHDILSKTPEQLRAFSHYRATSDEISLAYNFHEEGLENDFAPNPRAKRQRADDTPLSPMDGLKSRMPSISSGLSRRFRSRKFSPTVLTPEWSRETSLSRANSTRAPSLSSSLKETGELDQVQMPLTPTHSPEDKANELLFDHRRSLSMEDEPVVDVPPKPTTPLLPPVLTQMSNQIREVESPLQSPSVAKSEEQPSLHSPLATPRTVGIPSPPLSSKPSVASFHHQRNLNHTSPTSEITPIFISDPQDHWADQLGHANFEIEPQPYLPTDNTEEAFRDLCAAWLLARQKYEEHMARICDSHGSTSKTFRLTQEKWSEIEARWQRNLDLIRSHIPLTVAAENFTDDQNSTPALKQEAQLPPLADSESDPSNQEPKTKPSNCKPSLGITPAVSKFPAVIEIGPMEQGPARSAELQPQRRKRKLTFFKWVQGVWPNTSSNLVRRLSSGSP